jgi:Flp pilus assembly protein TadD
VGALLGAAGDLDGAVRAFERAARAGVADAELQCNWGTALRRLGRASEACEHLRAALVLEPANGVLHYNLADALEALELRDEAAEHFRRAGELAPDLPVAQRLQALEKK